MSVVTNVLIWLIGLLLVVSGFTTSLHLNNKRVINDMARERSEHQQKISSLEKSLESRDKFIQGCLVVQNTIRDASDDLFELSLGIIEGDYVKARINAESAVKTLEKIEALEREQSSFYESIYGQAPNSKQL